MLGELEGRLGWKQMPQGILVTIPARRGAMTVLYGPVVAIWLVAASIHYWHLLAMPRTEDAEFALQMIAIGVYVLGFLFSICWVLWTFTNETALILDPTEIKIQRRVMGIELSTRNFRNVDVRNLRFIPPTESWASQGHTDPKTSRIQFQTGYETHAFGAGITEREAVALITRMQEIYNFPNYLESHETRAER
jgi:hypothetical protein